MPDRKGMPRAKRQRMCLLYQRMLVRISYDLDHSNAARIGITADLIATKHHVARIVSIIEAGL